MSQKVAVDKCSMSERGIPVDIFCVIGLIVFAYYILVKRHR